MYRVRGSIGGGDFVISRSGDPTPEELSNENVLRIVNTECTDLEANTLVWKCLGYRYDPESEAWTSEGVFPKWRERYPSPPDFIGMQRVYEREVDQVSLRSNQALVRSVPVEHKQSLKRHLRPLGFRGFQYSELTPNLTRRAQCSNWLLYYREELFGYTVDELLERKRAKMEKEEREKTKAEGTSSATSDIEGKDAGSDEGGHGRKEEDEEWKPPVREVI